MHPNKIINPLPMGIEMDGRFRIEKFRGDICTYSGPEVGNLFLINAIDYMMSNSATNPLNPVGVIFGAGNITPSESQSALQSRLGTSGATTSVSSTVTAYPSAPVPYIEHVQVWQSAEGAVVGNIAELALAVGNIATPTRLNTRALVKDVAGNPTTVTVASDEFIRVTYAKRYYATIGVTGVLNIATPAGPLALDYEIRPVMMQSDYVWYKTVGDLPTGMLCIGAGAGNFVQVGGCGVSAETAFRAVDASSGSTANANRFEMKTQGSYTPGSKTRTDVIRLSLLNGNIAAPGIRSIFIGHGHINGSARNMIHQVLLSGPFQKLDSQIFDLPVTTTMGNAA